MTIEEAKKLGFRYILYQDGVIAWFINSSPDNWDYVTPSHLDPSIHFPTRAALRAAKKAKRMAAAEARQDARVADRKAAGTQVPPPAPTETPAEKDARNPLLLAKHGKSVESHETPVGETQAKEVVTDETQTPKPTTVLGWLETIPDATIREAAIGQSNCLQRASVSLGDAIYCFALWAETDEGYDFWRKCEYAALDGTLWPSYPPKSKQVKDGWTDEEIDKAAFKSDAVSHPSHYTSHPSGVECITITKHMNFCRGNAVKYLWRAGQKGDSIDKEIEDIAKAEEYCRIEKERLIAKKGAK